MLLMYDVFMDRGIFTLRRSELEWFYQVPLACESPLRGLCGSSLLGLLDSPLFVVDPLLAVEFR